MNLTQLDLMTIHEALDTELECLNSNMKDTDPDPGDQAHANYLMTLMNRVQNTYDGGNNLYTIQNRKTGELITTRYGVVETANTLASMMGNMEIVQNIEGLLRSMATLDIGVFRAMAWPTE